MSIFGWHRMTEDEKAVVQAFVAERPVRVGALAKALGLEVFKSTMHPKVSGQISPSPKADGTYVISVNRHESPERQRFTIAHEIAHYLLHRDRIGEGVADNTYYRSDLPSSIETEANKLAADLIMPTELIKSEISALGGQRNNLTAEIMARSFGVSLPAMMVRLGIA